MNPFCKRPLEGGSTHVPPTQPVFRVVLLHTELVVQDLCPGTVCIMYVYVLYIQEKKQF